MVNAMITELEDLKAAVSEDKLFQRATLDCIEAMIRFAVVGRSIPNAIVALDLLRQQLERADRP
jgi:hypothetical protein